MLVLVLKEPFASDFRSQKSMSTRIKTLVGAVVAGLAVLTLAMGSALAQETDQPTSSGCSCCRNMQNMQMGS